MYSCHEASDPNAALGVLSLLEAGEVRVASSGDHATRPDRCGLEGACWIAGERGFPVELSAADPAAEAVVARAMPVARRASGMAESDIPPAWRRPAAGR